MRTVIIVSKCLRVTKFNRNESRYEFHYKGVFKGSYIKKIVLHGDIKIAIDRGEEYLIFVESPNVLSETLFGKIIKIKNLNQCNDIS